MFVLKLFILIILLSSPAVRAEEKLLHVSFDVNRELLKEINDCFIKKNNIKIKILQSHGGSGKQTSSVIHGLPADVVSLALPYHMDLLAKKGIVANNWRDLFPNNASPFSTNIVFLVRKNNPKNIKDWDDLAKPNVEVITANPKTSGGALWNYLAAWIYAMKKYSNDQEMAKEYMSKLYNNVPILDSTARNSAITFIKRNMGDVLITWASEAEYIIHKLNPNYEIIEPSISIDIDIPVAITLNKNKQDLAKEYVNFLFLKEGQNIITKYYYQPFNQKQTKAKNIVNPEDYINWYNFKKDHFNENGIFEQIYK